MKEKSFGKLIGFLVTIFILSILIGGFLFIEFYITPNDCFEGRAYSYCIKNYDGYKGEFKLNSQESFQCRTDNGRTNMVSFSEEFNFLDSEIKYCNRMLKKDTNSLNSEGVKENE